MKMPIAWHKQCLANQKSYLENEKKRLVSMMNNVERIGDEIRFYEFQIIEAEEHGKDGFDQDKYGRKVSIRERSK